MIFWGGLDGLRRIPLLLRQVCAQRYQSVDSGGPVFEESARANFGAVLRQERGAMFSVPQVDLLWTFIFHCALKGAHLPPRQ